MLSSSAEPLCPAHDLVMLDLDGVVYISGAAVPGAAAAIEGTRAAGGRVAFVTNNASRTASTVAAHLSQLGVPADVADVVTSAQAAAHVLRERHGAGARVVCLGGPGLHGALEEAGLVPVGVSEEAQAIASGYGPELRWHEIMSGAVRIRDGLPWLAANADATIPTKEGIAPGHGLLVRMLEEFSGVPAEVAGKPERPLLDETVRRVGGERPLMVGDRLDTDIEGAHNAGVASLLVLTGVTGLPELVAATPRQRPSYLSLDLGGLLEPHPAPSRHPLDAPTEHAEAEDVSWRLGGWSARVHDGRLTVTRDSDSDQTSGGAADWWRVVACAAWEHLDATGTVADVTGVQVPGEESGAR
ncbi:HAD-IIA family hydrolase [Nocardioides faecalis]|nr:HAD-IIA family hydrolase [Nocardioides faecalis]